MPKAKTKRSAEKRFKLTGKGKLIRRKAGKSHLLSKKSRKRKRGLRKKTLVSGSDKKKTLRILPHHSKHM